MRRGRLLLVLSVASTSLASTCANASTWSDLWSTHDQQAQHLLAQHPADAAKLFSDPRRRAYAELAAGHYPQAAELLKPFTDANSQYNRGNALARAGQLQEALGAYDAALKQAPKDADIRHNRDLVARALKDQPPQQQQKQQGGQSDPSDKNNPDDKKQDQSQQSNGQGENKQDPNKQQDGKQGGSPQQSNSAQQNGGQQNDKQGSQDSRQAQQHSSAGANPSGGAQQPQSAQQGQGSSSSSQARQAQNNAQPSGQNGGQNTQQGNAQNAASSSSAPDAQAQADAAAGAQYLREHQNDKNSTSSSAGTLEADDPRHRTRGDTAKPPPTEDALAMDQWLQRIPEDSGELLRRKFRVEYNMRHPEQDDQR